MRGRGLWNSKKRRRVRPEITAVRWRHLYDTDDGRIKISGWNFTFKGFSFISFAYATCIKCMHYLISFVIQCKKLIQYSLYKYRSHLVTLVYICRSIPVHIVHIHVH
jgi:hypothetical protein